MCLDILFIQRDFHSGVRMQIEADGAHSHILIAAPRVSDLSLFLVRPDGWRGGGVRGLSCFGRRSSSALRCDDVFWLHVSRSTASQCSRLSRFHFGAGRQFECFFGKFLQELRDDTATSMGAAAVDVQVGPRICIGFSMGRHRLQRLS